MAVHWVLFLWFLLFPTAIIIEVFDKVPSKFGPILYTGLGLFVVYVIALWIIKSRWVFFPWQHDKD